MKAQWKKYYKIGAAAFILFLCIYYWGQVTALLGIVFKAAMPVIVGCAIAYIVNILMSFYERHYFPKSRKRLVRKSARPVCLVGALVTLLLIVVAVLRMVVPELISCFELLFAQVPDAMEAFANWLAGLEWLPETLAKTLQAVDWDAALAKIFEILTNGIGSTVSFVMDALSSAVTSVMNLAIGTIFAVYLLAGKERLKTQCSRMLDSYVRPAWKEKLHDALSVLNDCFHRYIVGQCTEAVILGVLCALGMLIFGFPYAVMTGAVVGVTALVPIAGAYIGGTVGFLLILTTQSPMQALLFVVYLLILQQLEGNLIYPRVVGSSIGLPGIWVLATVTIGGGICGITGMLLGVPLAAALYQFQRNSLHKREQAAKPPQSDEKTT